MSLFNALRTSVSGMNAQSSGLSAIGDNIANASTVGYKDAQTQFETVLGHQTPTSYESGGVLPATQINITGQGTLQNTTSSTDLAVHGNGFFVVTQGGTGGNLLTRAGSFAPDGTGNLVNTAGYTLMGYQVASDGTLSNTLAAVNVSSSALKFSASTEGTVTGNLPSTTTPSSAPYVTQATFYDSTGTAAVANLTYTNTGPGAWTVDVTDASTAAPLGSGTLTFDSTGTLTAGTPPIALTIPNSGDGGATSTPVSLDFSALTQVASSLSATVKADGAAPSSIVSVTVGKDGTLTGVYGNATTQVLYKIPLATVTSPDNLTSVTGNAYQTNDTSGSTTIQTADTGAAGSINSDNLEASTVDLATELTNMIVVQRAYEANSKVLQAASDLLSKLNQIQTG